MRSSLLESIETETSISGKKIKKVLGTAILCFITLVGLSFLGKILENVDAKEICVIQDPWDGDLHWYTTAGYKWQWFGTVTKYPKRNHYKFNAVYEDRDGKRLILQDHRLKIGFNDGGGGKVDGSIQYDMPLDPKNLSTLHEKFGSPEAIQAQLIETVVKKSIYLTGPMMSSRESYAEKKSDLIHYVDDQIREGVYKTRRREEKTKDVTGTEKTVVISEIILDKNGLPERQEPGQLTGFGLKPFNFSISELDYDDVVLEQIKQQQKITMAVQTSIARAREAEQNAITVGKEGEAKAAAAKWEQEVIKAKEVTAAEQRRAVAKLDAESAALGKEKSILEGQGEATKRQLIMGADGALDKKLAAYVDVNRIWADAFAKHPHSLVPSVVMSGSSSSGGNAATQFMEMMGIKAARELAVNPTARKNGE